MRTSALVRLGTLMSALIANTSTASAETPDVPIFQLKIQPVAMDKTKFQTIGSVKWKGHRSLKFVITPQQNYTFSKKLSVIDVKNGSTIDVDPGGEEVDFVGETSISSEKCAASDDEIYCLNKALVNPEVESDGALYQASFELPAGYSALTSDTDVIQFNGLEFQVAHFAEPVVKRCGNLEVEFIFPEGFQADPQYLSWFTDQLTWQQKLFGKLPHRRVKVGVIRRGGTSSVNGNPSGNLILFSRTAFGGKLSLSGLEPLHLSADPSEAICRAVIAHEISHFWFGAHLKGQDGWMVEGIPQYIAFVATATGAQTERGKVLLEFFRKMAEKGPEGPIPRSPLRSGADFHKAYYQAPVALFEIGTAVGHRRMINFLLSVYSNNNDPVFGDFDLRFRKDFPTHVELWKKCWRLKEDEVLIPQTSRD